MWIYESADDIMLMTGPATEDYLTWAIEAGFGTRNVGSTVEILGTVDDQVMVTLYAL